MSKAKVFIIVIIIIALSLSAVTYLRFREGTQISAKSREDIIYPVIGFRQDDSRWSTDSLGNSKYTMEKSGCVTTCIATAVSNNFEEITPGSLNRTFSENNVYDENGNLQWSQLEALGYTADVPGHASEAVIYDYLTEGKFPIVRVRVNGLGNFHYVLIVGIENGEYICMDPLKDGTAKLSDYWNRVYAVRVVYR